MLRQCPACGSEEIDYVGIDDGGGDYGDSVCDTWRCCDCDYHWEENCIDPEDTQLMQLPLFEEDKKSWHNYS